MSLEENEVVAGMEQADAAANLQKAMSLLNPFLAEFILSNPITSKKMRGKKTDFSQSLQAIIDDWKILYPTGSKFANFKKYFLRAKKVRNLVAHQSFDCNKYQHDMEYLAQVATAIGKPKLADIIFKLIAVKDDEKEEQGKCIRKAEKNDANVAIDIAISSKKGNWTSIKEEGNQFFKQKLWREAMNCYTRAIHLNQEEAVLYSNRALCEFNLSKFDLAREDIEDAIQLDPKNVKYFRILSEVLLQMKMHQESLAVCLQGLAINPRDEVLNIRERDCRALIASDETDKNPTFGISMPKEYYEKGDKKMVTGRYKSLHLTYEDIEDCPNWETFMEHSRITVFIGKAHQYKHGKLSATQGSAVKAFEIFEAAAKKGSAEGLYNVAMFYNEGKAGLPRDFHKVTELCRKAASQKAFIRFEENMRPNIGVAEAEAFLGNCYRDGRGVDQCSIEAFKWYLKAARHDCPTAQNNLGVALLDGNGCQMDEASARSWFQKAAEHGLSEAQCNYATMLARGRGGPMDIKKASDMLKLSADQGNAGALIYLQELSRSGALGASSMKETKENLEKTAKTGDPASLFLLGFNYLNGSGGFDKDLHKAEGNFRAAAKAAFSEAYLPLGELLLELKKNEEAFEFIKLSAEKGSAEGQFELGMLFANGHGCARDEGKARRWLNRAKQQGKSLQLNIHDAKQTSSNDWVERAIDHGKELCDFETQKQLKSEGMSIQEREKRFISSNLDPKNPATDSWLEFLDAFSPGGRPIPPTPHARSMRGITSKFFEELISRAENGSVIAQSFFKACEIMEHAMILLEQQQTNDAFILFRLYRRAWDLPIREYCYFYLECVEAAEEALDRNSQDANALYVLVCLRMACQSNEENLLMAKRCVELDPSVPDFHQLLSCMLGFVGDHKNGLRAIDQAIEMLPNETDWLYTRATHLRLMEKKKKNKKYGVDAVEAYLKFISTNPIDHRKFPEACFSLAEIYALKGEITNAKTYYQKGLEAEDPSIRLPCFEPVEANFPGKMITKMLLKASELGKKMPLESTADTADTAEKNNCANCFKSNQSLRCTACKSARYCDRACQIAHWKKHKGDCKRVTLP